MSCDQTTTRIAQYKEKQCYLCVKLCVYDEKRLFKLLLGFSVTS